MSWDRWRGEIAKAVDGSHHTIEGIDRQLASGRLHAWMKPDCCLLIEFVRYPKMLTCQIMWAAGELEAILAEEPAVAAWAKAAGCAEMLVESRPAWSRALKAVGFTPWSVTVRKGL